MFRDGYNPDHFAAIERIAKARTGITFTSEHLVVGQQVNFYIDGTSEVLDNIGRRPIIGLDTESRAELICVNHGDGLNLSTFRPLFGGVIRMQKIGEVSIVSIATPKLRYAIIHGPNESSVQLVGAVHNPF